ncbi:heparan-alpha-glucosaminide N-acetyltransferase domain-containing protein, partial [Streptomyces alfalfae]
MTHTQPPHETTEPQEHSPPRPGSSPEPSVPAPAGVAPGRLIGLDVARALAVFGMYIVHIGPSLSATDGVGSWVRYLADGHSSVLFATLAGFSLMLIAGRREPKTGLAGRQARARIVIRAVVLLVLGTALAMEYGGVIILAFYGVYFLLALPLVRLRAGTLALIAAGLALVAPQLAFALKSLLSESVQQSVNAYDPLKALCDVGVLDLLLTGFYPALTWMP